MADVISFEDIVRSRRRRRQQELTEQCVQLIEINLRIAVEVYSASSAEERQRHARQIRQLSELLEYALTMV